MRRGDVMWNGSHAINMLDGAFVKGDAFEFQLGLITILDCCRNAVKQGRCRQWWMDLR